MSTPPQFVEPEHLTTPASTRRLSSRFWALFGAVATSGIGDGMVSTAFPLLAARLTDSPKLVAGVAVAAALPNIAALYLGAVIDRVDRRRLAASNEFLRAAMLVVFALVVGTASPSMLDIYLVVFIIGLGRTITETTAQVALPRLVDRSELGRANGLLATAETGSEHMAGQALGGVIFAVAASLPFLVDGISFVFSGVLLLFALPALREPRVATMTVNQSVKEGWQYFRQDRALVLVALVIVMFASCQAMVFSSLVLFVKGPLGLGEAGFGILMAIVSVGSLAGGLISGRIDSRWRADLVLIVAGVVIALAYALTGLTTSVLITGIGLFIESLCVAVGSVVSIALRQRLIPEEFLGRVAGIFRFLIVGCYPIGAVAGGVLASAVELRTPLMMAAGLQLLAISVLGRRLNAVLRDDPRLVPG